MSSQHFGERLAQLRREKAFREGKDIDHRAIAKAIGASPASVSRWEAGEVYPGDGYLQSLAKYFGVTRGWLRFGEGERDAQPSQGQRRIGDPAAVQRIVDAARPPAAATSTARKHASGRGKRS